MIPAQGYVLAYDIETIPNDRAREYSQKSHVDSPSNYKDPIKIEKYLIEQREKLYQKSALNWWTGRVLSFACINMYTNEKHFFMCVDERTVLQEFARVTEGFSLVGKSSSTFDDPFMVGRYLANNMPVPNSLKNRENFDIDKFFGFSSASGQRGKLDDYAFGLGMKLKSMKGNQVAAVYEKYMMAETVEEADYQMNVLKEYNLYDAEIVAQAYRTYYNIKIEDYR